MSISPVRLLPLALLSGSLLAAQPVDDTKLKQVILFARHAVRSPVLPNTALDFFSTRPSPNFSSTGGNITTNGRANEILLGAYFRLWLTKEGLLTNHDSADAAFVYSRANGIPLIVDTAQAFWTGLLPAAPVNVISLPGSDPLYLPVNAGVARLDADKAVAAVQGRLGNNPQALATAFAP